jgi:hypothetical protein
MCSDPLSFDHAFYIHFKTLPIKANKSVVGRNEKAKLPIRKKTP